MGSEIIAARMLNEWVYCPRLGILMALHKEFEESADTVEGSHLHRRQDRPGPALRSRPPKPEAPPETGKPGESECGSEQSGAQGSETAEDLPPRNTRSLWLQSDALGFTAKLDAVEVDDEGHATPIDTKRGKVPNVAGGVYPPERIQLGVQALLLRENGYPCTEAALYYAGSRRRVRIPVDDRLMADVAAAAEGFRAALRTETLPPPLEASPKCPRCSLVAICLPEETRYLAGDGEPEPLDEPLRPIAVRNRPGHPLVVSEQGAKLGVSKGRFSVKSRETGKTVFVRARDTSAIVLMGNVQISAQAIREAAWKAIPVAWHGYGGRFHAMTSAATHKNIFLRRAQFRAADDGARALDIARAMVRGKIRNQRTLLRRNADGDLKAVLRDLRRMADKARDADGIEPLLGYEGVAARLYFGAFNAMLHPPEDVEGVLRMAGRNRRPPRDPVNALLGFAYTLLTRDLFATAQRVGFDPMLGFLHQPGYGKPALALDLMEEFRPLIADSVVLRAINNGEVGPRDFAFRADGCVLTDAARRRFIGTYERRVRDEVTHPIFGYRVSWRRVMEVQTRLLGRVLLGEIERYTPMETR